MYTSHKYKKLLSKIRAIFGSPSIAAAAGVVVYRIVIRRQQQCQRASKSTKQSNFTWTTRQSNLFRTTSAPATPGSITSIKSPGKFYKSLATSQLLTTHKYSRLAADDFFFQLSSKIEGFVICSRPLRPFTSPLYIALSNACSRHRNGDVPGRFQCSLRAF